MTQIFVSTTNLTTSSSLLETLQIYNAAGIRAVELGSGHRPFPNFPDILSAYGFEYTIHNYFPLTDPDHLMNIASLNQSQLDKTINIAKQAISLCSQLGGALYSIHAGYRSDIKAQSLGSRLSANEIESYKPAFQVMVKTIQELCDYARGKNIQVAVENHVLAPFNLIGSENQLLFLCSAEEIKQYIKAVDRTNFGMLIDLGHLKVTANTLGFDKYQFIESVSPWISMWHLSENDGQSDQALPFRKGVWFEPVIKQFPTKPCVIETQVKDASILLKQIDLVSSWRT